MKKTLATLGLLVAAGTAQAGNVSLDCSYTGVNNKLHTRTFHLAADGASSGNQLFSLSAIGNSYVLVGRAGDQHTINRETLSYRVEILNRTIDGSCQIAEVKNKI